ncbi:hypothetical protein H632_c3967p0, partial [Helicosporidium sp. ATCC 50920]
VALSRCLFDVFAVLAALEEDGWPGLRGADGRDAAREPTPGCTAEDLRQERERIHRHMQDVRPEPGLRGVDVRVVEQQNAYYEAIETAIRRSGAADERW